MQCCRGTDYPAAATQFGPKVAERDLQRYVRKGPDAATRLLLGSLLGGASIGDSLLDIGGGVGVVSFELLAAGLKRATLVEASPSYLDSARHEAERRGCGDRLHLLAGDFSRIAASVGQADVVTMHRVICCYPAYEFLLRQALSRCRERFAFSYPRDRWYIRLWIAVENLFRRMMGNAFSAFVHPPASMQAIIREAGFHPVSQSGTAVWCVEMYARTSTARAVDDEHDSRRT